MGTKGKAPQDPTGLRNKNVWSKCSFEEKFQEVPMFIMIVIKTGEMGSGWGVLSAPLESTGFSSHKNPQISAGSKEIQTGLTVLRHCMWSGLNRIFLLTILEISTDCNISLHKTLQALTVGSVWGSKK